MPALIAVLIVVAVHLATGVAAWTGIGLLADDRFAVGLPALMDIQQLPLGEQLHMIFFRDFPPEQPTALYRPFVDLVYLTEYHLFGTDALGQTAQYHVRIATL